MITIKNMYEKLERFSHTFSKFTVLPGYRAWTRWAYFATNKSDTKVSIRNIITALIHTVFIEMALASGPTDSGLILITIGTTTEITEKQPSHMDVSAIILPNKNSTFSGKSAI